MTDDVVCVVGFPSPGHSLRIWRRFAILPDLYDLLYGMGVLHQGKGLSFVNVPGMHLLPARNA